MVFSTDISSILFFILDVEQLGIPDQKYPCVIEMPSAEFQKICRDIATFSDTMSVMATKSGVVFSGTGDAVTNKITYSRENNLDDDDENVGCFPK